MLRAVLTSKAQERRAERRAAGCSRGLHRPLQGLGELWARQRRQAGSSPMPGRCPCAVAPPRALRATWGLDRGDSGSAGGREATEGQACGAAVQASLGHAIHASSCGGCPARPGPGVGGHLFASRCRWAGVPRRAALAPGPPSPAPQEAATSRQCHTRIPVTGRRSSYRNSPAAGALPRRPELALLWGSHSRSPGVGPGLSPGPEPWCREPCPQTHSRPRPPARSPTPCPGRPVLRALGPPQCDRRCPGD